MTKSMRQWILLTGVIAVVALGFTLEARAECNGNNCVGEIVRLYVHSTAASEGLVLVGTDGDEGDLNCTPFQKRYVVLTPTQPLFREMYDLLLEALNDDDEATVRIEPESTPCKIIAVILDEDDSDDNSDD